MSNIVKELYDSGCSDAWRAKYLGMDGYETLRLKKINGLASLIKNNEFSDTGEPEVLD